MIEFKNEFTWGKAVSENSTKEFHEKFEKAIDEARKELGQKYPIIINGKEIYSDDNFSVNSPSDAYKSKLQIFPKLASLIQIMQFLVQKMPLRNGVIFRFKNESKYLENVPIIFPQKNSSCLPY